jgi:hypothetical protein
MISCPECANKVQVPDNLIGKKVKCPVCQGIYVAKAEDEPEVVVEELEPVEDEPRSRRRRDEDDHPSRRDQIEERPRRRGRDEDDDEGDRPRKRRRKDDEDDEDDRPRKRRREDDYDDEDEPPKKADPRAMLQWSRLSLKLIFIGVCVALGSIGMMWLFQFLGMAGVGINEYLSLVLVGLPAVGATATITTGLVFAILGPKKKAAFGLAIAVVSTAGVHLLFQIITMIPQDSGYGSHRESRAVVSMFAGLTYQRAATALPGVAGFNAFDGLYFVAGLSELGLLVVSCLWMRALMLNYSKGAPTEQTMMGIWVIGGAMVLMLILGIIFSIVGSSTTLSMGAFKAMIWIGIIVNGLACLGAWGMFLMVTLGVKNFMAYQKAK